MYCLCYTHVSIVCYVCVYIYIYIYIYTYSLFCFIKGSSCNFLLRITWPVMICSGGCRVSLHWLCTGCRGEIAVWNLAATLEETVRTGGLCEHLGVREANASSPERVCNPAAETALHPLIRRPESIPFRGRSPPEKCFLADPSMIADVYFIQRISYYVQQPFKQIIYLSNIK